MYDAGILHLKHGHIERLSHKSYHLPTRYMKLQPYMTRTKNPCNSIERGDLVRGHLSLLHRCNRLICPLARMSGLQCFNMGHNGHGIYLYGVSMTLMGN